MTGQSLVFPLCHCMESEESICKWDTAIGVWFTYQRIKVPGCILHLNLGLSCRVVWSPNRHQPSSWKTPVLKLHCLGSLDYKACHRLTIFGSQMFMLMLCMYSKKGKNFVQDFLEWPLCKDLKMCNFLEVNMSEPDGYATTKIKYGEQTKPF